MIEGESRVLVLGHRGMVGSAIYRRLAQECIVMTGADIDARNEADVRHLLDKTRPDTVVLAAALVGGIVANQSQQWSFLTNNLLIELAVMRAALHAGVPRLLFLGSSCIYPREAPQPIVEEDLLTGPLEKTNEGYAIAKIAGLKMVEYARREFGLRWISCMPTNLYGPGDRYDPPEQSHVLAAMVRRIVEARRADAPGITFIGTGVARREFLHVDDLADACALLLKRWDSHVPINVGSGQEVTIAELARLIAFCAGYEGDIFFGGNTAQDGTPRKRLETSRLANLGWRARISLEEGIDAAIRDYEARYPQMMDAD